jgi:hypothetical protein
MSSLGTEREDYGSPQFKMPNASSTKLMSHSKANTVVDKELLVSFGAGVDPDIK